MFASSTAEVINLQKNQKSQRTENVFSKILFLHKKLKELAQYESLSNTDYKLARLNPTQMEKIKMLESGLSCHLVAFEYDSSIDENKCMILNRISSLLDEYLSICKAKKTSNTDVDFSKFFEQ